MAEDSTTRESLKMTELTPEMRTQIIEVLVHFLHNKQIHVPRKEFLDLYHKICEIFPKEVLVSSLSVLSLYTYINYLNVILLLALFVSAKISYISSCHCSSSTRGSWNLATCR